MSNELGAGNPEQAKNAMAVTLKLSMLLALAVVLFLGFGHDIWAGLFSDSSAIIKKFSSMTPLLAISIIADSVQGVLSGWDPSPNFHLNVFKHIYTSFLFCWLFMVLILVLQVWPEEVVGSI